MGTKKNKNENELAAAGDQSNAGKGIFTPIKAEPEEVLQTPNGPEGSEGKPTAGSGEFELEKEKEAKLDSKELKEKGLEEKVVSDVDGGKVHFYEQTPEGPVKKLARILGRYDDSNETDLDLDIDGEVVKCVVHKSKVESEMQNYWE